MPRKILVVDDSLTVRRVIADILEDEGWVVIEAQDGNEGLAKLEEHPDVKLIFSDINMPWMNGIEMVEQIKSNPAQAKIPICMLTTETAPESLEQAKKLGVNAYLVKPVQQDQLKVVIQNFTN